MTETVSRASQCLVLSTSTTKQANVSSVNMYILDKAFHRLLQPLGLTSDPVPFQTIVRYLKEYIVAKGLFDSSRPNVILCGEDPLGSLFKRVSFTNFEAVDLIRRHISPVYSQKLHDVGSKLNDDIKSDVKILEGVGSDNDEINYASSSPSSGEEDDIESGDAIDVEIAFSNSTNGDTMSIFEEFQKITRTRNISSSDFLSDSSDSGDSVASRFTEINEFEPFSELDSNGDAESYSSASDLEIHIVEKEYQITSVDFNEEEAYFADSSDEESYSEKKMNSCNPWFCKCPDGTRGQNGFCHNCWSSQFGWSKAEDRRIPPGAQKRKRKQSYEENKDHAKRLRNDGENNATCDTQLCTIASSPELLGSSGEEMHTKDVFGNCVLCESRPRNTAFVHGRSAHIVACYKCSRKVQEKNLKCPQCRRTVERVVRLYS